MINHLLQTAQKLIKDKRNRRKTWAMLMAAGLCVAVIVTFSMRTPGFTEEEEDIGGGAGYVDALDYGQPPSGDEQAPPTGDEQAPAGDEQAPPTGEEQAPAGDEQAPPTGDEQAPAGDEQAPPTGDEQAPTGDEQAPAGDAQAPAGDAQAPTGDEQTPTGDAQAPTGDVQTPPEGQTGANDQATQGGEASGSDGAGAGDFANLPASNSLGGYAHGSALAAPVGGGFMGIMGLAAPIGPATDYSDLKNFITDVTVCDANGGEVTSGFRAGSQYTFEISFAEAGSKQFAYNTSNHLTYDLPSGLEAAPVGDGEIRVDNGSVVGSYTIDMNGHIEVWLGSFDNDGNPINENFITHYTDASLKLDIEAVFSQNTASAQSLFGIDDTQGETASPAFAGIEPLVASITPRLKKVDADDGSILSGAVFSLYVADSTSREGANTIVVNGITFYQQSDSIIGTPGDDGTIGVPLGANTMNDDIFLLVETTAPTGYVLPERPDNYTFFTVNDAHGDDNALAVELGVDVSKVYANVMNLLTYYGVINITNEKQKVYLNIPCEKFIATTDGTGIYPDTEFTFRVTQCDSSYVPLEEPDVQPFNTTVLIKSTDAVHQFQIPLDITKLIPSGTGKNYYFIIEEVGQESGWINDTYQAHAKVIIYPNPNVKNSGVSFENPNRDPRCFPSPEPSSSLIMPLTIEIGSIVAGFVNEYTAPAAPLANIYIPVTKVINGDYDTPDPTFTFNITEVTDDTGSTGVEGSPYNKQITITGSGTKFFHINDLEAPTGVAGDEVKTYYFKISELNDNGDSNWHYDTTKYIIQVDVTLDSSNNAVAEYKVISPVSSTGSVSFAVDPGTNKSYTNMGTSTPYVFNTHQGNPPLGVGSSAAWVSNTDTTSPSSLYYALCAESDVDNFISTNIKSYQNRDDMASALAYALTTEALGGLNKADFIRFLALPTTYDDTDYIYYTGTDSSNRFTWSYRANLMRTILWMYEYSYKAGNSSIAAPPTGNTMNTKPSTWPSGMNNLYNGAETAAGCEGIVPYNRDTSASGLNFFLQAWKMIDEMMQKYNQGITTSLYMNFTPDLNTANYGTLTFGHVGFVPYNIKTSEKSYDLYLSWTPVNGTVTVTVNGATYTDPYTGSNTDSAKGISVRETDTVTVAYTGSVPTFTLVDNGKYLKAGSLKGVVLSGKDYLGGEGQKLLIGHAKFVTLQCTLTLGDNGNIVFTNTYDTTPPPPTGGAELPETGGPGRWIFTLTGLMLMTAVAALYMLTRKRKPIFCADTGRKSFTEINMKKHQKGGKAIKRE